MKNQSIILIQAATIALIGVLLFGAASEALAQEASAVVAEQPAISRAVNWVRNAALVAVHWVGDKAGALAGWVREQGTKIARAFFGSEEQPIALDTEPRVAGETALSEDIPLDAPPPPQQQNTVPSEPVSEPVVAEPEPAPPQESLPSAPADAVEPEPIIETPPPQTETVVEEIAPNQEPVEQEEPREEKRQSTPAFILILARDTQAPTSEVSALSATTTIATTTISWTGHDTDITGSPEVRNYDIQYQVDSGEWQDWLSETVLLSSLFTGTDEKTYGFRSRGRDKWGNLGSYPDAANTSTYFNLSIPVTPAVTSHASGATLLNTEVDEDAATGGTVQVTLSGTGEANNTLTVTLSETSTTATTTIDVNGNWSQQFTLAEGANNFTLKTQEADGDFSNNLLFVLNLEFVPTRDVVINEIAWMGTAADTSDEWLELYNASSTAIALTNWTLAASDNTPSITLSGTIAAKSYFLLERTDDNTVSTTTADGIYGNDGSTWALNNAGETLTLRNADNLLIDKVGSTTVDWFAGNNTTKATMERKDPTADGTVASNWADNDGSFAEGKDANGTVLKATPRSLNSANTTIPRSVTDLQVQHVYTTSSSFRLYWTTPKTANLATTTAATYDLRYSTSAITESNWASATQVTGEPTPSTTQGTVATSTVSSLSASTTYYFALKTHNGSEESGLSNVYTATTEDGNYTQQNGYPGSGLMTRANSPYLVTADLSITNGSSLTIEAGTVVKMYGTRNIILGTNSSLIIGSASDSVNATVITSRDDNTYGGTYTGNVVGFTTASDGNPAAGDWRQISMSSGTVTMNNAIIRYGGVNVPMLAMTGGSATIATSILEYSNNNIISIANDATSLTLTNSTIQGGALLSTAAGLDGLGVSTSANINITGTTFTGNRRGIAIDTSADEANITISGNNFFANNRVAPADPNAGIHVSDTDDPAVVAQNNWWGSASGPTLDTHSTADDRDGALDDNNGSLDANNLDISNFATSAFSIKPNGL